MSVPPSFIKNIAIQLRDNYEFDNSPIEIREEKEGEAREDAPIGFFGRKELTDKFVAFLNNDSQKGVFLVTGYRGMGKTSFVNNAISNYKFPKVDSNQLKKNKNDIIAVQLTIAQNNPNEIDILRQIVSSIYEEYLNSKKHKDNFDNQKEIQRQLQRLKTWVAVLLVLDLLLLPVAFFSEQVGTYLQNRGHLFSITYTTAIDILKWLSYPVVLATATFLIILFCKKFKLDRSKMEQDQDSTFQKIKGLVERTFANVSEEVNSSKLFNLDIKGIKAISEDQSPKKGKNYPIANAKEIEYELKAFLKLAYEEDKVEFIFIFDELDKIELSDGHANMYQDLDTFEAMNKDKNIQNMARNRKQAVMNIITGLKNFFSTAKARFIFIAGREMFDASLADVADKQSPLSSIFTYTFNIESLLKVEEGYATEKNTSSLTNAIEEFLKYQLLGNNEKDPGTLSFFEFLELKFRKKDSKGNCQQSDEYAKIYFFMQAFITYLAYRSNGSPKKLIKAFHEFVTIRDKFDADRIVVAESNENNKSNYYLYFNYYNQCRIGFINYLYRPFLIEHGRSFKLFSDNAVTSVPYLFDHLIKFHPFAFSRSHLELVPELLSTNKTPAIKQDLDQIISYLGSTHMRDTDIELFEFKFYSRSYNEIKFLSRIFEEEAAAFNFTLDESHPVKLLLIDKIKELRSIFSKFNKESGGATQIFSIAYHNGNLGDLHFFDQEFDDAITNYSDAIRPINHIQVDALNLRDFITLIRNKLKIGLCFEKINSYEEALTFYSDSSQDAKRFISYHLNNAGSLQFPDSNLFRIAKESYKKEVFHSSSLNDLLQIIAQCFLAKIYIQEKMGLEGMSTPKLKVALGDLLKIADGIEKVSGRNNLIIANVFLHIGKLLYFKNSATPTKDKTLSTDNYPEWMNNRLSQAREMNGEMGIGNNGVVKRQPLLAYNFYLLGLDEVLRSREEILVSKDKPGIILEELIYYKESKNGAGFPVLNILDEYFKLLKKYLDDGNESYIANHFKYIGCLLSSIGDTILGMYNLRSYNGIERSMEIPKNGYNKLFVSDIFNAAELNENTNSDFISLLHPCQRQFFSISDVLRCYYLSAQFFGKFGRVASASFQYRKILHVLRLVLTNRDKSNKTNKWFVSFLEKSIVKPALEISSICTGRTDDHMKTKARKNLNCHSDDFIIDNIANHPDTREIKLIFEYIKLKLGYEEKEITKIVNSNYQLATQYSRILELDYFSKYVYENELKQDLGTVSTLIGKEDKIINYLFSMTTILRILKIYGTDFMLGHSFVAYTHKRIADFLLIIDKAEPGKLDDINKKLESFIGTGSRVLMDYKHHYSMAKDHYHKAIQLHIAGDEYKKSIHDMIYLEDDFNDNAYHFGVALDRYMLVKGIFSKYIDECDKGLKN